MLGHSVSFYKNINFYKTFPTKVQVTFENVGGPLEERALDDEPD